jgi:hypothetical protein
VDVVPKHGQANGEGSVASPDERQPARRGPRTGIGLPIIRYAYAEKERRGVLTAPDAAPSVRVILPRQHLDVLLQFVDHRGNPVDPPSEKRICTRARISLRRRASAKSVLRIVLGKMRCKARVQLHGKRRVGALRLLEDVAKDVGTRVRPDRRLRFRLLPGSGD